MKIFRHVVVLFLLLLLIGWFLLKPATFLLSDVGLRFLQVRSLIEQNWTTLAIPYQAQLFDPNWEHVPYYYAYTLVNNELFLSITPFLPILASIFYAIIGPVGLLITPILGTVLAALAVYRLAQMTELPHATWFFWITAVATPLFFYALELWDHSLAAACGAWAVAGVSQAAISKRWQPALWGGVALGIGLGQRPEMYVFALALGLATLLILWPMWKTAVSLTTGAFLAVLPIWFLQYNWVGHPLGMAVATNLLGYGRPEAYPFEPVSLGGSRLITKGRFLISIRSGSISSLLALLLILFGILILFTCLRQEKWRTPRNLYIGIGLSLVGYLFYVVQAFQNKPLLGLVTTIPFIVLSFAFVNGTEDNGRYRSIYKLTLTTALLFLGLMLLFWPASGGLQWSARYLMPVVPLLVYLAEYTFYAYDHVVTGQTQVALRRTAVLLLSASVIISLTGLYWQTTEHQYAAQLQETVTALPAEIILTNAPFTPAHISGVENKIFLYVNDEEEIATLVERLFAENVTRIAILPLNSISLTIPETVDDISIQQVEEYIYDLN